VGSDADWITFPLKPVYQAAADQENGAEQFIVLHNSKLMLQPLPHFLGDFSVVSYLELFPAKVYYDLKRTGQDGLKTSRVLRKNPDFLAEVRQTVGRMDHNFFCRLLLQERECLSSSSV